MTHSLEIRVVELRNFATRLLDHLEATHGATVHLDVDYYWSAPQDQRYDVSEQPELTIGQLSENLDFLRRIDSGQSDTLSYALVWLGELLRAVGEKHVL